MAFTFLWNGFKQFVKRSGKLRIGAAGDPCCCSSTFDCSTSSATLYCDLSGNWNILGCGYGTSEYSTPPLIWGIMIFNEISGNCTYHDNTNDSYGHFYFAHTDGTGVGGPQASIVFATSSKIYRTGSQWYMNINIVVGHSGFTEVILTITYKGPSSGNDPRSVYSWDSDSHSSCTSGHVPPTLTVYS